MTKMADDEVIEILDCSGSDICTKTVDSDCEIQEDSVPLIEVGSDEENFVNGELNADNPSENADPHALFKLTFNDEQDFQSLKECITTGIKNSLRLKGICVDEYENEELSIFFIKKEGAITNEIETENEALEPERLDEGNENLGNLFLVDTTPAENIDFGTIPSYKRSIRDVLNNEAKKAKKGDECKRPRISNTCFNCSGDHSLKDCPEPRNQSRINKAKKQFMGSKTEQRYHVDIEQRFAHLKPGHFSKNLKRALGLSHGELPSFVYKMRLLGYPPGWLEEAKVAHSGITLFDSEGREILESDEEEGEVENEKHKFDVTKIISFPGFNVDPGPGYMDNYKYYGAPPMQTKDSKDEFIKSLGDNIIKGYKRKKLKILSAPVEQIDVTPEPADMEIEDVDVEITQYAHNPPLPPPLPDDIIAAPPPPPPPEEPVRTTPSIEKTDLEGFRESPSLEDLEAKQKQLLEALTNQDDSLIDEVLALEREANDDVNSQTSELTTASDQQKSVENNEYSGRDSPQTPAQRTNKKSSILGTPLLKFSPYDKLPQGDLFKKGVSDVINFENLPDSTGKYEKIKVVIQKVRTIVTKLNNEN